MPGQQYSTSSLGGFLSQPYLTQKLRSVAQPMFRFRQFVDVKEAIGKNRGDTWLNLYFQHLVDKYSLLCYNIKNGQVKAYHMLETLKVMVTY